MIEKIGAYEILAVLDDGQQPIYRARGADGREVALKTVRVDETSPESRQRFEREAELCSKLDCPNLVRVYESGEADGILYQAMELLEGQDLARLLAEGRVFTWDEKLAIMGQICNGLSYIHQQQIVHRDVKPGNLFLEDSGGVRVLDFGLARVEASKLTRPGLAAGTLSYMAPEQVRGATCTAATDVFLAGIVFFELATGRHPFSAPGANLVEVIVALTSQAPPNLRELAPDAPEALEMVIARALEKDPARRFQNGTELKEAFKKRAEAALLIAQFARSSVPTHGGTESDPKGTVVMKRVPQPITRPAPPPAPPKPPPAPPRPDKVFCPACTWANPTNAAECESCGRPLKESVAAESQSTGPEPKPKLPIFVIGTLCFLLLLAVLFELLSSR